MSDCSHFYGEELVIVSMLTKVKVLKAFHWMEGAFSNENVENESGQVLHISGCSVADLRRRLFTTEARALRHADRKSMSAPLNMLVQRMLLCCCCSV